MCCWAARPTELQHRPGVHITCMYKSATTRRRHYHIHLPPNSHIACSLMETTPADGSTGRWSDVATACRLLGNKCRPLNSIFGTSSTGGLPSAGEKRAHCSRYNLRSGTGL